MNPEMNNDELTWLVENRAALPKLLLKLHDACNCFDKSPASGAQRLAAVGFTLWRALPLMPPNGNIPNDPADDAKILLEEIIIHNRITYAEEQKCAGWLIGFYLNVAEERIVDVAKLCNVNDAAVEACAKCVAEPTYRHELPYRRRWEIAFCAFETLIGALPFVEYSDNQKK